MKTTLQPWESSILASHCDKYCCNVSECPSFEWCLRLIALDLASSSAPFFYHGYKTVNLSSSKHCLLAQRGYLVLGLQQLPMKQSPKRPAAAWQELEPLDSMLHCPFPNPTARFYRFPTETASNQRHLAFATLRVMTQSTVSVSKCILEVEAILRKLRDHHPRVLEWPIDNFSPATEKMNVSESIYSIFLPHRVKPSTLPLRSA